MLLDVHGKTAFLQPPDAQPAPVRPTVVLVHGALNDHSVWCAQAQALGAAGHAVLAPDLPGHGQSAGPALASVEALADWLLALLDAAAVDRAILVGHSMGALVALEATLRAPARAAGLALLGATYPMRVSEGLLATARDDEAAAIGMVATWSHAHAADQPEIIEEARALMARLAVLNPAHLLYTDLNACNRWANGEAAATGITCPTLLIQGERDRMTPPRSAVALQEALAHAEVVRVDAGHAMMAEAAEAVSAALCNFVNRVR